MDSRVEKFIVKGSVQGVGFRYCASHQALKLELTGYAKNLNNGDVEVVACGETTHINELYQWLHQGSPMAQVEDVSRMPMTDPPHFTGFGIE